MYFVANPDFIKVALMIKKNKKVTKKKADGSINEAKTLVASFCEKYLDPELAKLSGKLLKKVMKFDEIKKSRPSIIACSVMIVIARLNFLFDKENIEHIRLDDMCKFFDCKKNTASAKASSIENILDISIGDKEFSLPEISDELSMIELPNGLVATKNMVRDMPALFSIGLGDFEKYAPLFQKITGLDEEELRKRVENEMSKSGKQIDAEQLTRHEMELREAKRNARIVKAREKVAKLTDLYGDLFSQLL